MTAVRSATSRQHEAKPRPSIFAPTINMAAQIITPRAYNYSIPQWPLSLNPMQTPPFPYPEPANPPLLHPRGCNCCMDCGWCGWRCICGRPTPSPSLSPSPTIEPRDWPTSIQYHAGSLPTPPCSTPPSPCPSSLFGSPPASPSVSSAGSLFSPPTLYSKPTPATPPPISLSPIQLPLPLSSPTGSSMLNWSPLPSPSPIPPANLA